jgi:hypothetical protein
MHLLTMDQLDRYEQKYQKTHPEFVLVPSDAAAISKAALDWGQAKGKNFSKFLPSNSSIKFSLTTTTNSKEIFNRIFYSFSNDIGNWKFFNLCDSLSKKRICS